MPMIEIRDGVFHTTRFGDAIEIAVPKDGRVELETTSTHTDVELRQSNGAVFRRFRLPKEGRSG